MIDEQHTLPATHLPPMEGPEAIPPSDPSPFLTVCLIVKDEEENLPRCLESLRAIGEYQLVVVDTGSTDRTMEIAREFEAEIHEHSVVPWNFAKARNIAMGYARGDWIFSIDADEELHAGAGHLLRQLRAIDREDIGGADILVEDMQQGRVHLSWTQNRLARRSHHPHWVGGYHNRLHHDGDLILLQGVILRHYGYDLSPEEIERKLARTEEIIRREMADGPGDYRGYFYLAHQAAIRRKPDAALDLCRTYVDNASKLPQFNGAIYHLGFRCAMSLGDTAEADRWLSDGIRAIPEDLDIAFDTVLYGTWRVRQDLVIEGARRYMAIYDHFEEQLARQGNRWTYSYTPSEHAWVCRQAALALMDQASTCLERHKGACALMGEQDAADERDAIARELGDIGIKWTNQ